MTAKTRKGRNPYTGEVVAVPVRKKVKRAKRAKRAKVAKKAVRKAKRRVRLKQAPHALGGRELINIRIAGVEREALELKAQELNISFSEVIRQGLQAHYELPEVPLRKEKVIS
jgi:hypothetical protein